MGTPRMMFVMLGAAAIVVAAVASLALDSWWILVAVLALHLLAAAVVIGYGLMRAGESYDKPDPVTEARLEEEGRTGDPHARRVARDREVFN
jgi:membrane protein implicated in regulation of membrane protease activity